MSEELQQPTITFRPVYKWKWHVFGIQYGLAGTTNSPVIVMMQTASWRFRIISRLILGSVWEEIK